ncbi:MAG: tail fiber protein [Candidatus Altiarchaeia archaeon]
MEIASVVAVFMISAMLMAQSGSVIIKNGGVNASGGVSLAGDINISGAGSRLSSPGICLAGDCRTSWPSVYTGEIRMFAGDTVPSGWLACEGQELNIVDYPALYFYIGILYGGNGATTFKLPDMRSRVPIGKGQGDGLINRAQGSRGGNETINITLEQMPVHKHDAWLVGSDTGTTADPTGAVPGKITRTNLYAAPPPDLNMSDYSIEINNTGEGVPHQNMEPFLAVRFMIKT